MSSHDASSLGPRGMRAAIRGGQGPRGMRAAIRGGQGPRWMPWVAALVGLLTLAPARAQAQAATCEVNNAATCTAGGLATFSINLTITTAAVVTTPNSIVNFPTATAADFTVGAGSVVSVPFVIRSNTSWALAISSPATTWTAAPASARQNKPRSDLEWSTAAAGTYAAVTGAPVTFTTGAATGTGAFNLWLRVRWAWTLDTPGNYTIPVTVTLTAP